MIRDELIARILFLASARARRTKNIVNGLEEGEFYLSENEVDKFGLSNTQSGKLRRAIQRCISLKLISKVENKTGRNNSSVYVLNKNETIYWGYETENQTESKQRADREPIENEQRQTKNDKNDKNDKSEDINNSKELTVVPTVLPKEGVKEKGLEKKDHRRPDIQEGIDLLKEELKATISDEKYQRFALKRLIDKKGKALVFDYMRIAYAIREMPYAPQVFNYLDLEQKWDRLVAFSEKEYKMRKLSVFDPDVDYRQFLTPEQNANLDEIYERERAEEINTIQYD